MESFYIPGLRDQNFYFYSVPPFWLFVLRIHADGYFAINHTPGRKYRTLSLSSFLRSNAPSRNGILRFTSKSVKYLTTLQYALDRSQSNSQAKLEGFLSQTNLCHHLLIVNSTYGHWNSAHKASRQSKDIHIQRSQHGVRSFAPSTVCYDSINTIRLRSYVLERINSKNKLITYRNIPQNQNSSSNFPGNKFPDQLFPAIPLHLFANHSKTPQHHQK